MPNWISPKTITGDAATGERYLRREHLNEYFWREVIKGNHILFVAPRRVGKTSIMKDLAENPIEDFFCIYQNIEGVKTRNEFYQRLFELILKCASKAEKAKALISSWFSRYSIEEITKSGIKLKGKDIDYENEIRNLIPELKKVRIHTVIFLDEFAEVIHKLKKKGHQQDAIDILHMLREMRGDDDFRQFTLVFAGSIGLQFVIKNIDRPKLINDLHVIETKALEEHEADTLIKQLTRDATIQLEEPVINYLKKKVQHLLPYYIQLMLEEIDLLARETNKPQIMETMVDIAFERVLKKNKNFEDWLERLKDYQPEHFSFINAILIRCAQKNQITVQEIFSLASDERFNRTNDYMDFVEELMNDGYLTEIQSHVYRFISPFLQQFWLRKYPVYND